jgi:CDP-6-deoxy-D-xylo-4-hexulose-3-dehydrase
MLLGRSGDEFLIRSTERNPKWGNLSDGFPMKKSSDELREEILRLTQEYSGSAHRSFSPEPRDFVPGETVIPYAGRVFDAEEVVAAVASSLDFWLTLGAEGDAFEKELAGLLGAKRSLLTNSGSSANLLAVSALTSHKLPEEKRLKPGDEVITVAAGFPTTVAPILQNRAVPVFIDSDPLTLNARCEQLEEAFCPGKTRAVIMAHTLGNPCNLRAVTEFCARHGLWLIEDNCDALGAEYFFPESKIQNPKSILTGTFGDMSTQSFYPPHHMTLGEGGSVNIVRDMKWKTIVESFRDWGRDCWCASGKDNTCGKRFGWQLGELPEGYDHKYIYSHVGYNLKPLDLQAAIGRAQLKKLPAFIRARRENWNDLRAALDGLGDFFDFQLPTHATAWKKLEKGSLKPEENISAFRFPLSAFSWDSSGASCNPSWFGFMLMVKPEAPFSRADLARHLEAAKIGNRPLFGGNLTRQPALTQLKRENPAAFRVVGDLGGADAIMNRSLFIGVYPGLTRPMLDYMAEVVQNFAMAHR